VPDVQGAQGSGLGALSEAHSARDVAGTAIAVYRSEPVRVAGTAAIVFGVAAALSTLLEIEVVEKTDAVELEVAARVATAMIWGFAVVFYAGLLDLVVGATLEGRTPPSFTETLRTLPIGKLFGADSLLMFGTAVGLVLFVVPGLVFFTLFALVGPIIVTESLPVRDAFARSARLDRPHFWLVVLLVTIPVAIEDQVMHVFDPKLFDHPLLASFLVTALIGIVVGSLVGLLEVALAHALRHGDPQPESPRSGP